MPTRGQAFPSENLRAADLEIGKAYPVTISRVKEVQFERGDRTETKWAMYFNESSSRLVLNVTNWETIEELTGEPNSDNWRGHEITLYLEPRVKNPNGTGPAIRVMQPDVTPNPESISPLPDVMESIETEAEVSDSEVPF